jgi:hypothetical protein
LETELKSKINAVLPVSNDVNIILNKKYKWFHIINILKEKLLL